MRITTTISVLILTISVFFSLFANNPDNNDSYTGKNETLFYNVLYNYGVVSINAGEFELTTNTIDFEGEQCYYFQSESRTNQKWKWLYDINSTRNVISSVSDLQPIKYNQSVEHGRHKTTYSYNFEDDSILIKSFVDGKKHKTELKNNNSIYDALTAVHYVRTLDFNSFNIGDSLEINVLHDTEFLNQKIFFKGIVNLIKEDGQSYECYKFSSIIKNNDIISASEPAEVWVSTDKRRLPLKIIVKITVGSVEINLMD